MRRGRGGEGGRGRKRSSSPSLSLPSLPLPLSPSRTPGGSRSAAAAALPRRGPADVRRFADLPGMAVNCDLRSSLGLGLVIFFHELGHFAVAKWCGVFVERFSIGFGPILLEPQVGRHRVRPVGGAVRRLRQDARPGRHGPQPAHQRRDRPGSPQLLGQAGLAADGDHQRRRDDEPPDGRAVLRRRLRARRDRSASRSPEVAPGSPAWRAGYASGDRIARDQRAGRSNEFDDLVVGVALSSGPVALKRRARDGRRSTCRSTPDAAARGGSIGLGYTIGPGWSRRSIRRRAAGRAPAPPPAAAKPPLDVPGRGRRGRRRAGRELHPAGDLVRPNAASRPSS